MNRNITSVIYIVLGIIALIFAIDLLFKVIGLIIGLYWLFTGLSMLQPQPRPIVFMRTMYGRFLGRF